jgi:nitroreductase
MRFSEKNFGKNVVRKALSYCIAIITLHPFKNGNHRTSLLEAEEFLRQNTYQSHTSDQKNLELQKWWIVYEQDHDFEREGDMRATVANATTQPACRNAPLLMVIVLDVEKTRPPQGDDFSGPLYRNLWCYEAGSIAQNTLLEAAAWGLTANAYLPTDNDAIRSTLRLEGEFTPLFIVPIGTK